MTPPPSKYTALKHTATAAQARLLLDIGPPMRHLLEGQPFISSMGTVRLRPERALELKRRLWALLSEFHKDDEGGGAADYTLSLQLVRGRVK